MGETRRNRTWAVAIAKPLSTHIAASGARSASLKAAGLRPDRAAEQIRTHENKFAEIDYMIPERGDPELIGRAFRVPQQIPPLRR
jgi:hypothetical protein